MDNSAHLSTQAWATPRPAGIALAVGGVILLVAAVMTSSDPAGLVLMGVAGLLLMAFAAYALLVRPRLAITDDAGEPAIAIRTIGGTHVYPHDRIDRIRLLDFRRIGRRTGQIEFDVLHADAPAAADTEGPRDDTRLIVFSRWDLGTDLGDVAESLRRAGFDVEDQRK
ncbi:PH domain-containing protein [Gordonia sp. ABSL11-1]|uniref:PH domain-containing protein n=1 Tax=Gordonia sp. ABSL11-1 TaxID=3053924 RepID=UPI0025743585|nr:PH domain-containing protein [Gordonia sp. ABSL11-1]MDL9947068.1 PH domain-containing protein [Gordonia sp. ABSL11-1]